MKLIDLLREHLTEWPDDECIAIAQDGRGGVFYWQKMPEFEDNTDTWSHRDGVVEALLDGDNYFPQTEYGDALDLKTCEDYHTAIITRELFEANMKETTTTPVVHACDLIKWRDRIIEINRLIGDLSIERNLMFININKAGFKLDLDGMK